MFRDEPNMARPELGSNSAAHLVAVLAHARAAARNEMALWLAIGGAITATALALRLTAATTAILAIAAAAAVIVIRCLVHRLGQAGGFGLEIGGQRDRRKLYPGQLFDGSGERHEREAGADQYRNKSANLTLPGPATNASSPSLRCGS
eukprot:gene18930-19265_t